MSGPRLVDVPRPRGGVLAHDLVDPERGRRVGAVDAIDARHPRRAAGLERVTEEQPDRALPDHRDARAGDVAEAVELVQHGAQRLHDGRLDVRELVVERVDRVQAGDEELRQAEVVLRPADDPRAGRELAGDDLADDLVQRVAGLAVEVDERVAPPIERRKIRAADPAGQQPGEHATRTWLRHRRFDPLESPGCRDRVRPHVEGFP